MQCQDCGSQMTQAWGGSWHCPKDEKSPILFERQEFYSYFADQSLVAHLCELGVQDTGRAAIGYVNPEVAKENARSGATILVKVIAHPGATLYPNETKGYVSILGKRSYEPG